MAQLTSREALQLAADFARKAEYMRADDAADFQTQADLYETASRIAFLRAHMIARAEEVRPAVGKTSHRSVLALV
jgi:hypothetical protein